MFIEYFIDQKLDQSSKKQVPIDTKNLIFYLFISKHFYSKMYRQYTDFVKVTERFTVQSTGN